jgi:hypothetical protein
MATAPTDLTPLIPRRIYKAEDYYNMLLRLFPKGILWNFQHEYIPEIYVDGIVSEEACGVPTIEQIP